MLNAVCTIRSQPHYRAEAFVRGLARAGYAVGNLPRPMSKRDLLITWNRYGQWDTRATHWEKDGGTVLVAENGYFGHDAQGRQYYALAAHGHNGSGWWPAGDDDRWIRHGVQLAPWQDQEQGFVAVRGQRGIGTQQMASPSNWHLNVGAELLKNGLPARIFNHPALSKDVPAGQEEQRLVGARACVIWASSLGVKALVAGIPVWYAAPHWICEGAAQRWKDDRRLTCPVRNDTPRIMALRRMAWAQWSVAELESGEPFVHFRDNAEKIEWS